MARKIIETYDFDQLMSEDIQDIFDRADENPCDFIRAAILPERMIFSNCSHQYFKLECAIVIFTDKKGKIHMTLFDKNNVTSSFQCAILPNQFIVFTMTTGSGSHLEERLCFDGDEKLLLIMQTYNSTIFVTYDGNYTRIGHDYVREFDGFPSVTRMLIDPLFMGRTKNVPSPSFADASVDI